MLQQLMKYAIVMAHGIDPPLVSGSFPNNPRPSGINAVRYVQQKMYRTAVAFARPSNLLVLDEPTNDLDLETLDLL